MNKPFEFDEMLDPAFAEIYFTACQMEKEGKIEPENTTEELAKDCKKIAAEYVSIYNVASKISEPCFYDDMYPYAERRLIELYPPSRDFTVLIDAQMTLEFKTHAVSREEAEKIAREGMKSACFMGTFRKESRVYDMQIGDVIEK